MLFKSWLWILDEKDISPSLPIQTRAELEKNEGFLTSHILLSVELVIEFWARILSFWGEGGFSDLGWGCLYGENMGVTGYLEF